MKSSRQVIRSINDDPKTCPAVRNICRGLGSCRWRASERPADCHTNEDATGNSITCAGKDILALKCKRRAREVMSSYRVCHGAHPSHSSTLHSCDVVFARYLPEMCAARHDIVQIACGCGAHTVFVLTVAH